MKAVIQRRYRAPESMRVEEADTPEPRDLEALVRVRAASVNRTDCANHWSEPFFLRLMTGIRRPRKPIPGTVFAGEVVRVGPLVQGFREGDRVWGYDDAGNSCFAEYAAVSTRKGLGLMPESLSFEEAAACVEGGHYAINFLNKVALQPGQSVLVNGATGAIGSAAVQLLAHEGLAVTAVCPGGFAETVRRLGAARVIDFEREDFTRCGESFDYVFDAVGKSAFGLCKPLLRPGGVYISSELGPYWQNPFLALATPLGRGRKVKFPLPFDIDSSLRLLKARVEAGAFSPLLDRVYAMEDVAEAFRYVHSGVKIGNVVLRIG